MKVMGKTEYLCLHLNAPEDFRRKVGLLRPSIHTATRETGYGDLMVDLSELGLNAVETVALVKRQIELAKTNPKPVSAVKYPAAE